MYKDFLKKIKQMETEQLENQLNDLMQKHELVMSENFLLNSCCRDKRTECYQLEQKLKEVMSENDCLKNSNTTIVELEKQIKALEEEIKTKDLEIENAENVISNLHKDCLAKDNKLYDEAARRTRAEERADYFKNLAENYQSMPDLKKLVENIAEYKIPDAQTFIDALKQMQQLTEPVKNLSGKLEDIESNIASRVTNEVRRSIDFMYSEFRRHRF